MFIAKPDGNGFIIGDYRSLFPEWCFNINGPEPEWFQITGCLPVSSTRSFDPATEQLVGCDPYEENGTVYMVRVETLPTPEPTPEPETPPQ